MKLQVRCWEDIEPRGRTAGPSCSAQRFVSSHSSRLLPAGAKLIGKVSNNRIYRGADFDVYNCTGVYEPFGSLIWKEPSWESVPNNSSLICKLTLG